MSITPPSLGQEKKKSNLKAVLIVGQQRDGIQGVMAEMDFIADLFTEKEVKVYKFYNEKAIWDEITKVAADCNFLVYMGHGSTMGENGKAGGIYVDKLISTKKLKETLDLKDNALVIFQSVCYGAGSSAIDTTDIGIDEAKSRVTNYSYPFFEIGASGYYANNFNVGTYDFLSDFLSGLTLKQAFLNSIYKSLKIEFDEPFPDYPNKYYSIASSPEGGIATRITYINGVKKEEKFINHKGYKIAYAGNPKFSVQNMK